MGAVVDFFLGEANDEVGANGNASISAAMTGVISPLRPGLSAKIKDVDVVKPDVGEVLAANDEQPV